MSTTFKDAYELKIGEHVEKKGKFSYLSWCYAVRYLRENYPDSTWKVKEDNNGLPFFPTTSGYMVCVTVTHGGLDFAQWHPVLNFKNKPIPEPDAFDINTAIQRCLTKAIALATGIGLGLYAGEDLPTDEGGSKVTTQKPVKAQEKPGGDGAPITETAYNKFVIAVDKCKTIDEFDEFMDKALPHAEKVMAPEEYKKAVSYSEQLKATFI